ncbi:MAG: hypothetical protein IRY90_13485, partial [Actinomadura rubrobrunea]|nr:hypothetical protein [Actinomadura rubrobrunea]
SGGAAVSWNVLLVGVRGVASVEGGALAEHEQGVLVHATSAEIVINLEAR